jgi:hypothetical protein
MIIIQLLWHIHVLATVYKMCGYCTSLPHVQILPPLLYFEFSAFAYTRHFITYELLLKLIRHITNNNTPTRLS